MLYIGFGQRNGVSCTVSPVLPIGKQTAICDGQRELEQPPSRLQRSSRRVCGIAWGCGRRSFPKEGRERGTQPRRLRRRCGVDTREVLCVGFFDDFGSARLAVGPHVARRSSTCWRAWVSCRLDANGSVGARLDESALPARILPRQWLVLLWLGQWRLSLHDPLASRLRMARSSPTIPPGCPIAPLVSTEQFRQRQQRSHQPSCQRIEWRASRPPRLASASG